ncbi:Hypothetical protein A7982_05127 [Minicystis rosea]|nr:Hypothetical protein A7982_05127 [Minicystis rosea]
MRLRYALLALLGSGAAAASACSATPSSMFTAGTGGGGAGMPSAGSGAGMGSGGENISLTTGSAPTTGTGSCQTHCSADLHSVVDCNGNVLSTCPADQGCGANGCVPACDSAKENKSTIGCDYYSVDPDIITVAQGACFAAFVANTWTAPVTISVERAGQTLNAANFSYIPTGTGQSLTYQPLPNGQLPAGQVAIVFLATTGNFAACPAGVNVGLTIDAAVHGTGLGNAFHIVTSAPTVAYDIFPYGGGQSAATSATLLLPTTAWDTNYIAVDAFRKSQIVAEALPTLDVVAAEDGTEVTISPTSPISGGPGVPGTGQGVPMTYNLSKGQILQFTQSGLVGSPIQSNKPIGVWGGATCLSVDVASAACDSAHQQIPPVKALGDEYVAVRYRDRFDGQEESPPWRIIGTVAGTTLTYEPQKPAGAPDTLDVGQVAEFRAAGPFIVKSQDVDHPFYMAAYMTGCQEVSATISDCRGDPEFVNVIPPQQYLGSYVFFTDPTYPETNLVLVRRNDGAGFKDVNLDCAGVLGDWQPIGTSGKYEYTRIDLVRHNFQPQGSCDNGRHEIHSDAPFGLVVWGWGSAETGGDFGNSAGGFYSQAVSYAYPAGASVQPINTVVIPPIPK